MPYMCHVHNGMYITVEGVEGCQHGVCIKLRELPDNPKVMFNISTLKRQNSEGSTTAGEEREALGDRWNDPKIGRAN